MAMRDTAHIGILTADFFIPEANSLKAKRSVLRCMKDRLRNEFNVSASEIAYQDKWQRSQWSFCLVGPDKAYVDSVMQRLLEFLRSDRQASLTDYRIEFL